MINISCGIIITDNKRVLLGQLSNNNFLDIPNTEITEKETYLECALNSLKNEVGLNLSKKKDKIQELGLFPFSKSKMLYLFKYTYKTLPDINKLKCSSFVEINGTSILKFNSFKYVDLQELNKFTNMKNSFILSKVFDLPLTFEQNEDIRRTMFFILRHKLEPDSKGKISPWIKQSDLYNKCVDVNPILSNFSWLDFLNIVKIDTEDRFSIDHDKIKVNYGHSLDIDEEKEVIKPPNKLYHLTFSPFVDNILKEGLKPMTRKYVFMAANKEKAESYTKKLNDKNFTNKYPNIKPVLLEINSKQAYEDGIIFYKEKGNNICAINIPIKYIKLSNENIKNQKISDKEIIQNPNIYFNMVNVFNQN